MTGKLPLKTQPIDIPDDETAKQVYVCPAHPYLDRQIQELKQQYKDSQRQNERYNEMFKEEIKTMLKPAVDFFKEEQAVNSWLKPWKDRFWKILCGVLIVLIMALIVYFTPL